MFKQKNIELRKEAVALIDILQKMFPKTFPKKPDPKVPLAIGIFKDLCKIMREEKLKLEVETIAYALKLWCRGIRYLEALSKAGSPRYDFYGNVRGEVSEQHAKCAIQILEGIYKNKL